MKVVKTTLRDAAASARLNSAMSPSSTYFVLYHQGRTFGFVQRRRLEFDSDGRVIGGAEVKVEFPSDICKHPAFWYPLFKLEGRFYGILPYTAYTRPRVIEISDLEPNELAELPCDISGPAQYALQGSKLVAIGRDALFCYDIHNHQVFRSDAWCRRNDAEIFCPGLELCILDHRKLSLTCAYPNGDARRLLLQDGHEHGFSNDRTVAGMPVSHIYDIQFIMCCGACVIYKIFSHPEDVISYLRQKEAIYTRIYQNPELFCKTGGKEEPLRKYISPTTDCDVLFRDLVPARRSSENELLAIERTDPRKGIYLQSLRYYRDLRSFYEIGYILVDLHALRMYYRPGVISLLGDAQFADERLRLCGDDALFESTIGALFGTRLGDLNNSSALVDAPDELSLSE